MPELRKGVKLNDWSAQPPEGVPPRTTLPLILGYEEPAIIIIKLYINVDQKLKYELGYLYA